MSTFKKLALLRRTTARKRSQCEQRFFNQNFKLYLKETTLHGLRFVGDESITIWERGFFFLAIIAALIVTTHLIYYTFAKWQSIPIIIGVNPRPTSISEIPFPAITLCNMNQLLYSKVWNYSRNSAEGAIVDMACFSNGKENISDISENYKNNNLSLAEFFANHGQSCKTMLRSCELNSEIYNCSDLFHEGLADEGLCCVFNSLHPFFRFRNFVNKTGPTDPSPTRAVPVDWNPEFGYAKDLPKNYYPRPARGIGVSMGLTLVLDAEYDEYYCSSANGAGFKRKYEVDSRRISVDSGKIQKLTMLTMVPSIPALLNLALNSPNESPRVKENGVIIGVGIESRYSVEAHNYVAAPNIRYLSPSARNCLFGDEGNLLYYKQYTRLNCENECQSRYVYQECKCIPFNLPLIYSNATICGAPHQFCVIEAQNVWLRSEDSPCRRGCLNSCFDYTYIVKAYTAPLVQGNYRVQNDVDLNNLTTKYIRENIVIIHFFFREFVFHGNTRNVYIGLTEFLSNVGGIMSLFLGFSFISLAEIFYYALMRPFFWWLKRRRIGSNREDATTAELPDATNWLGREILLSRREPAWMEPTLWNRWSHRQFKIDLTKIQMENAFARSGALKSMGK